MTQNWIWDNKGTGGKKGSFWCMNKLGVCLSHRRDVLPTVIFQLLVATEGHEEPQGVHYELKSGKFIASEFFMLNGQMPQDTTTDTSNKAKLK